MNFVGRVWREGSEMRGSVEFLSGPDGPKAPVIFFKSFDELKKILEGRFEAGPSKNSAR